MIKKWLIKLSNKDLLLITALIILNVLPRLFYFLNPGFFIDSDEAIFGTMVNNFFSNGHLPLFFYGQNYALVSLEIWLSSVISYFFGINIFSLKIAMLLFWLASIVILYYIGKKVLASRQWAFLAVFLVSIIPTWFDWATKARGGYLTALLFANIVILLTLIRKNSTRVIIIALSSVLIYYAQPLWLVILTPFIVYYFFRDYQWEYIITFAFNFLILLIGSRLLLFFSGIDYQAQARLGFSQFIHNTQNILNYLYIGYSGRSVFFISLEMNKLSVFISLSFIIILLLTISYDFYLVVKRKIEKIEAVFLATVLLYILVILFSSDQEFSYRYLLPVFIPSMFLIVLSAKRLSPQGYKDGLYIFLFVFSILSLFSNVAYPNYVYPKINDNYTEIERMRAVEVLLREYDVKCLYVLNWEISQELHYFIPNIKVRYQKVDFRYPQEARAVDLLFNQGANCALLGLEPHLAWLLNYRPEDITIVGSRYMINLRPQKGELQRLGFETAE